MNFPGYWSKTESTLECGGKADGDEVKGGEEKKKQFIIFLLLLKKWGLLKIFCLKQKLVFKAAILFFLERELT